MAVARQFAGEIGADAARCAGHESERACGAGHHRASRADDPKIRQLVAAAQAARGVSQRLTDIQRFD
jgi:hypothetical protein